MPSSTAPTAGEQARSHPDETKAAFSTLAVDILLGGSVTNITFAMLTLTFLMPCVAEADDDDRGGGQSSREIFRWSGRVDAKAWLRIRGLNGSIHAEPAQGDSAEIVATLRWRGSEPTGVHVAALPREGTYTVCALFTATARCEADGGVGEAGGDGPKGSVSFQVRLPRGIKLDAKTVNGAVHLERLDAPVMAHTTNGSIDVATTQGPVVATTVNGGVRVEAGAGALEARTTNGSIHARMGADAGGGDVRLSTTNGSIAAEVPSKGTAELDAQAVHGSVQADLNQPGATSTGDRHHLHVRLADKGRSLRLATVNGSIHVTGQ
jgi:hypothetical protein